MTRPQRTIRMGTLLVILALLAGSPLVRDAGAQSPPEPMTKEAVEQIIHRYLLDHPEVIMESVRQFQERQRADERKRASATIATRQDDLLRDSASPVAGNPQGDVTVVEFFDYRCGYCKRVAPVLRQLMAEDPNVRVVFKEFPILSPESTLAAKAALAAHAQGKYLPFHDALMTSNSALSMPDILKIAAQLQLDTGKLQADMNKPEIQAALQKNHALAQAMGITGTPAFIIGPELVPGAIELPVFKELIAKARQQ
ncbi:MAG: DsbA family protein [candidate division NC10 bacterium]|nr:DsbA family protein [candidate division NC10 bacterium]